jgi:Zn-dependent peptidase ImmA (M78 family)
MSAPVPEATLSVLLARLREAGADPLPLEPVFDQFLNRCRGYAALEKLVLGSVPLQFPAHLLAGGLDEAGDPLKQGLLLAERERERLELTHGAVEDLPGLIGRQGLKIVELPIPERSRVSGVFVFDKSFGPSILLDASRPRADRDYVLAHEYGHFLADHDPYRAFVCFRGGIPLESREEIRAHAFAAALLVSGKDLDAYLKGAGLRRGQPVSADLLRQLRTYFEADDRAILGRLLASGWLEPGEVALLLESVHGDPAGSGPRGGGVPARFIALAVQARHDGRLSLAEMAHRLDVDERTARRIELTFTVDEAEEPDGHDTD